MAVTENFYTGNGSTTSFSLTFEYLEEDDVKVTLNEVLTTAYSFANATTILFNTAPANGVAIRIYRDTDIDDLKSTFFAGSSIRAQDLNNNFLQNNFAVQEIQNYTWDNELDTIHSDEAWASNDTQIATTAAMDARFVDQVNNETIAGVKTFSSSPIVPTTPSGGTAATNKTYVDTEINDKINDALTTDIGTDGTGITVTDDGDGTITLGLAANSIDFDRIKNVDIITEAEQNAGSPAEADNNLFTALAAARRFDTLVQTGTPSGSNWETGKTWFQNDEDKTVSIWDGNSWEAVTSGGSFTRLDQVIYVDAVNGDDANNGHRISTPKATIAAALADINADATFGDGSVIILAPGVYQEVAPLDIERRDVSIIGQAMRSTIIHPTSATETESLFRVNSGTYLANLTFTGVKANGTRGEAGSIDPDATYGLPADQGWNVSFFPGATIVKSPYIQNCTNFSDSEIDNDNLDAHNPAGGAAGDTDSAMTGGGLLVDGSVVAANSPLRSMVCDSYTHVGLDGPGILVTNNGYVQATSSYAFFNHYHIKCLNGGQANLAASTTDFGRYALITDGRSPDPIFTATTIGVTNNGATTFTIAAPVPDPSWSGDATRPQNNMLVELNGITYPVQSAVANGGGWDVTIIRPDPNDRTQNLGVNGAVSGGSTAQFFLRSMIASSGHTMEYVGSGTNYSALPENGGVPVEANQVVELNNGKVWTAITDHKGKFKVGDTFEVDQETGFVNIPAGALSVNTLLENLNVNGNEIISANNGNIVINPNGTGTIDLQAETDLNSNKLVNVTDPTAAQDAATKNYVDTTTTANPIYVAAAGDTMSGELAMGTNKVTGVGNPTAAQDAATKTYVDTADATKLNLSGGTMSGAIAMGTNKVTGMGDPTSAQDAATKNYVDTADATKLNLSGGTLTGDLTLNAQSDLRFADSDSSNWIAVQAPATVASNVTYTLPSADGNPGDSLSTNGSGTLSWSSSTAVVDQIIEGNTKVEAVDTGSNGSILFETEGTRAMTIDSSQRVGVGTTSPSAELHVRGSTTASYIRFDGATGNGAYNHIYGDTDGVIAIAADYGNVAANSHIKFQIDSNERLRIDSSGRVGIGTSSPSYLLDLLGSIPRIRVKDSSTGGAFHHFENNSGNFYLGIDNSTGGSFGSGNYARVLWSQGSYPLVFATNDTEKARIDSSGRLGIGSTSPQNALVVSNGGANGFEVNVSGSGGTLSSLYSYNRSTSAYTDLRFDASAIRYEISGTERARIDSSGRLGIGTSSPGSYDVYADDLVIAGPSNPGITLAGTSTGWGSLYFADGTTGSEKYRGYIQYNHTDDKLTFATAATGALFIDSSQRVGIGTTSPDGRITSEVVSVGDVNLALRGPSSDNNWGGFLTLNSNNGTTVTASIRASTGGIAFNYGGSQRAAIDASGRLLVGTSSAFTSSTGNAPYGKFATVGATNDATAQGIISLGKGAAASSNINGATLGEIYFTDNAGNPFGVIAGWADGATGANDYPGRLVFSTTADGASSPTERMTIDRIGCIKVGPTTRRGTESVIASSIDAASANYANQQVIVVHNMGTSGTRYMMAFGDGSTYTERGYITWNGTTMALSNASDQRLKENIANAPTAVDSLKQMKIRSFNFIENNNHVEYGFVAQELVNVAPEAVIVGTDNEDGSIDKSWGVSYACLVPRLTKALQEALERIESLESEVAALKTQ